MRRKRDIKSPRTDLIRSQDVIVQPLNISSMIFLCVITLMLFTVASFVMYTFPYLLNGDKSGSVPKRETVINKDEKRNDGNVADGESYFEHSILKETSTSDHRLLMEERNMAMKKYSYPFDMNGVDKRSWLPLQEFRDVYDGKWPVIITDIVPEWPASNWTKEFFTKNYGQSKVVMQAVHEETKEALALPLELYLSHLDESSETLWTYLQDELFLIQRPELRRQILESVYIKDNFFNLFPREVQPWDCMLLWGTAYSRSNLHIDPYNWTGTNAVISGKKLWKLVPPGQDHLLGIKEIGHCGFPMDCMKYNSPIDAHMPRNEREKEMLSKIRFVEVEQNAGEMLFIPPGWFHQAFNPVPTLAVSGQLMNVNNYKVVLEEIFKAGSISRSNLPRNADDLNPSELVSFLASTVPDKVLEHGVAVTKNVLDQLNGPPRNSL